MVSGVRLVAAAQLARRFLKAQNHLSTFVLQIFARSFDVNRSYLNIRGTIDFVDSELVVKSALEEIYCAFSFRKMLAKDWLYRTLKP